MFYHVPNHYYDLNRYLINSKLSTYFKSKGRQFENELKSEHHGEKQIHVVQDCRIKLRLFVEFHCQGQCVDHDEAKYRIFKILRCHKPPDLVLEPLLWNISTHGLGFQGEFNTISLEIEKINIVININQLYSIV